MDTIIWIKIVMVCAAFSFLGILGASILMVVYVDKKTKRVFDLSMDYVKVKLRVFREEFPKELYDIFSGLHGGRTDDHSRDKGHKN